MSYEPLVTFDQNCILELKWWIENIKLIERKPLSIQSPELVIFLNAAKLGGWRRHQQAYSHVDRKGERTAYQYPGINGIKICYKNIHKTKESVNSAHTDRQHHCTYR